MLANDVNLANPVEIADGIYRFGVQDSKSGFHDNQYMLMDGDQSIIFNTGSSTNIIGALEKFFMISPINRITHAVLNGSAPQIAGAVADVQAIVHAEGGQLTVVAHPRASQKISFYYGIKRNSFYHVDQNDWKLTLKSGRTLRFIFAHNLCYPGSFMTYDEKTGSLFSGELFSGYSFGWSLYANEYYLAAMEAYHYDHMPFSQLIQRTLDGLTGFGVRLIAPNHGSLINKEIEQYMEAVRNVKKPPAMLPRKETPLNTGISMSAVSPSERSFA
jgi:flavorubredoxin